jgi:hypothetical protein
MRLFNPASKALFAPRQSRKTVSANPFSLQSIEAAGPFAAVRQTLRIVAPMEFSAMPRRRISACR